MPEATPRPPSVGLTHGQQPGNVALGMSYLQLVQQTFFFKLILNAQLCTGHYGNFKG